MQHRLLTDLAAEQCREALPWRGFHFDGHTLPAFRVSEGAPTGTPDAKFCFDVTNGKMYGSQSGSWVEIGASSTTANYALGDLTVANDPVDPTLVRASFDYYSNGSGASQINTNGGVMIYRAPRAMTILSLHSYCGVATGGGSIRFWKTVSGTALGSGTAITAALDTSTLTPNALASVSLSETALAAGDILGVVISSAPSGAHSSNWEFRLKPA